MVLKGATEGSVEVRAGGNLIAFDSTWEWNERRSLRSPSSSPSSSPSLKLFKSFKSSKASKSSKSSKSDGKSTRSDARTEQNLNVVNDRGGAVYGYEQSYVTLTNNKFLHNIAKGDGGALYSEGSIQLNNCELKDNFSLEGNGGGLFASGTAVGLIRKTAFENNSAKLNGPGMYLKQASKVGTVDNSGCGNISFKKGKGQLKSSSWRNHCVV